jgi:hypothetical protein
MSSITSKGINAIKESQAIPSLGQDNASRRPEMSDINTRYFFFIKTKIT